eukprot:bmy_01857T0
MRASTAPRDCLAPAHTAAYACANSFGLRAGIFCAFAPCCRASLASVAGRVRGRLSCVTVARAASAWLPSPPAPNQSSEPSVPRPRPVLLGVPTSPSRPGLGPGPTPPQAPGGMGDNTSPISVILVSSGSRGNKLLFRYPFQRSQEHPASQTSDGSSLELVFSGHLLRVVCVPPFASWSPVERAL